MNKKGFKVVVLLLLVGVLAVVPLFLQKGAAFGGSDDAGSEMVNQITGGEYQPWFTPIAENLIGGELPGEIESLLFCVQTGIGVGVIAFFMGRLVERKKQERLHEKQTEE